MSDGSAHVLFGARVVHSRRATVLAVDDGLDAAGSNGAEPDLPDGETRTIASAGVVPLFWPAHREQRGKRSWLLSAEGRAATRVYRAEFRHRISGVLVSRGSVRHRRQVGGGARSHSGTADAEQRSPPRLRVAANLTPHPPGRRARERRSSVAQWTCCSVSLAQLPGAATARDGSSGHVSPPAPRAAEPLAGSAHVSRETDPTPLPRQTP